jgi:hypothetical protein
MPEHIGRKVGHVCRYDMTSAAQEREDASGLHEADRSAGARAELDHRGDVV